MALTLTLRDPPPGRVEGAELSPERLRGRTPREIASRPLRCGGETVALGDLFTVSGTGEEALFLIGDLSAVDGIGGGMPGGRIVINGPCGDRLGAQMSGGEITVVGDVGAYVGSRMSGGMITVRGNAGDRLGGAPPGARTGMSGGEIVITGSAGDHAGAGLRRGTVAIGGTAGTGAGLRMIAGSVIALGGVGPGAGVGNRRGSIASGAAMTPPPGYAFATRYHPPALALQLRELRALFLPVDQGLIDGAWARWSGDAAELNRGEILIYHGDG